MINACDCKCFNCDNKAVAFYPCIDPDIPSRAYCPDACIVSSNELMNYAKKVHKSRWELEQLQRDIDEKQDLLKIADAIKLLKEYVLE